MIGIKHVLDYNIVYPKEVCTGKSLSPEVIRIKNNLTFIIMKKRTIPSEFAGYFFLTTNQVCGLYNCSSKTLKRRGKERVRSTGVSLIKSLLFFLIWRFRIFDIGLF